MIRKLSLTLASVLALGALAACDMASREERCTKRGGVVESERAWDKKAKRYVIEHECKVNGEEVDEWKTRA